MVWLCTFLLLILIGRNFVWIKARRKRLFTPIPKPLQQVCQEPTQEIRLQTTARRHQMTGIGRIMIPKSQACLHPQRKKASVVLLHINCHPRRHRHVFLVSMRILVLTTSRLFIRFPRLFVIHTLIHTRMRSTIITLICCSTLLPKLEPENEKVWSVSLKHSVTWIWSLPNFMTTTSKNTVRCLWAFWVNGSFSFKFTLNFHSYAYTVLCRSWGRLVVDLVSYQHGWRMYIQGGYRTFVILLFSPF